MDVARLWHRLKGRAKREAAVRLVRRPMRLRNTRPVISFTFDDFPASALRQGGAILKKFGVAGTYYAALGLMGRDTAAGPMFTAAHLAELVNDGHELGCHTFDHCHAWETDPARFEESILRNRRALRDLLPGAVFKTMSYPISWPRPGNKRVVSRLFVCCRSGGQTYSATEVDLNHLSAYFLEQSGGNVDAVRRVIDDACRASGWLIFATHDVREQPSRLGCRPEFFEEVVRYAISSGARILPVLEACELICDFPDQRAMEHAMQGCKNRHPAVA